MKKLFILGILAAFLLIAMPAMATDFPLYAGQTEQIGVVSVTNDADTLTITYTITEADWYMNESHVAVASTLGGIPQTKKGNAIPGKFAYFADYELDPVTTDTYTIDLPAYSPIVIAAQADVVHKTDDVYDMAEGAWAGVDEIFVGKDWDLYFTYTPEVED